MTGIDSFWFFARRYLMVLLSALPWLVAGVFLESVLRPGLRRAFARKVIRDTPGLALLSGASMAIALPDSLYEGRVSRGSPEAYRLVLSRALHPLLLGSVFFAFRHEIVLSLYYLLFVIAGALLVGLVVRLTVSGGARFAEDKGDASDTQGLAGRLTQRSYDHAVDLLFGAFVAAAIHSLLGGSAFADRILLSALIAYVAGGFGSPPPATAGPIAISLLPLGQPSIALAYLLGAAWGSYRVTLGIGRRYGRVPAAVLILLIALISVLLSSPISWSTLDILS